MRIFFTLILLALASPASAQLNISAQQRVKLTDGTSDAAVKAASVVPLTTDTALVVTLRDAVGAPGTAMPQTVLVMGGMDKLGNTTMLSAPGGALQVQSLPVGKAGLLWPCNQLRKINCR